MARHTRSRGSRKSLPQRQGLPVLVRRPSQASIDSLCHPRLPVRYLHAGLKMNPQMCCKTQRMIRELALRHIDFSIPYPEQPQSKLDFFKREVLLDVELSHLMRYEDAWAVEVFLGMMYRRPRIMRNLQTPSYKLHSPTVRDNQTFPLSTWLLSLKMYSMNVRVKCHSPFALATTILSLRMYSMTVHIKYHSPCSLTIRILNPKIMTLFVLIIRPLSLRIIK
ncbi:uncharacterized protein HD556DRAFT_722353 [Suillus plorans]|uniref:Uncharacterized protein n=1 Tax=Suillus plorans TaxID=116603 RepID=A0A9P7DU49_9AGAM|nr:uncharacterized protein HD556DRAFT_722353 [Suillus plorans]KAG1802944.1 hypothetical protein HD556DRAFT_722353 [Suillus plorans]